MSRLRACRMCLAVDGVMFPIADTPLQQIYENITRKVLQSADGRPVMACYICRNMLVKLQIFIKKSLRADHFLQQVLDHGLVLTGTTINSLGPSGLRLPLVVSPIVLMEWDGQIEEPIHDQKPLEIKPEREWNDDVTDDATENLQQTEDPLLNVVKVEEHDVLAKMGEPDKSLHGEDNQRAGDPSFCQHNEITIKIEERSTQTAEIAKECKELKVTDSALKKDKKPFRCSYCKKAFPRKWHLNQHIVVHTGEKYPCTFCSKTFARLAYLKAHINSHTGEKQYVCQYCSKSFLQLGHLKTHIKNLHTGANRYDCDQCKKTFYRRNTIINHIKFNHLKVPRKKGKLYHCPVCNKTSSSKVYLKGHMTVHTGESPFQCDVCSKTFSLKKSLKTHLMTHTKPYRCGVCNKTFGHRETLKTHVRIHTGETPYHCDRCSKRFGRKAYLDAHMLTHAQETHTCSVCGNVYKHKISLSMHLKTHGVTAGEKSFKCDNCGKSFSRNQGLKMHLYRRVCGVPENK